MPPAADVIRRCLARHLPPEAALLVGFSGGRDSTVLLHALSQGPVRALRSVHVNHGLQAGAGAFARHCAEMATRLGVTHGELAVTVARNGGHGLEAGARDARYQALREHLRPGEWLLTAHHGEDQLETVLLHLLRGSGMRGLAGIPRALPFGRGRLCRPLLEAPGEALEAYGQSVLKPLGLSWLTDPMNGDLAYDRSYLRQAVIPPLRRRFPAVAEAVGRAAVLAGESAGLLEELARFDALEVAVGDTLSVPELAALSAPRQQNLLRWLARERGWSTPPERRLRAGLAQLLTAGSARQPVLAWSGHEIRRFRHRLHWLDAGVPRWDPAGTPLEWSGTAPLSLGPGRGTLALTEGPGGLTPRVVAGGLRVVFRSGGERVRPGGDLHHRTLKYLFQARGVLPWMRAHIPLIFAGEELAAVANLWTADWAAAPSGWQVVWSGHAPIH